MPNRIIKESICVSDNLDKLTWFEECLFYRLIVNCDDYGRFDGRTAVIKNRLFPLKDNVTAASVEKALKALVNAELVAMYVYDGKPYLHLLTWGNHQTVRNKKSKYPAPEDGVQADDCNLQAIESNCMQMHADVPVIQSESNPNPNPNPNRKGARAPFTPPAISEMESFFVQNGSTAEEGRACFDFYASKGWKVGKTPMVDWKASARGWIRRSKNGEFGGSGGKNTQTVQGTGDILLRYTPEERAQTYSAAIVNFDLRDDE